MPTLPDPYLNQSSLPSLSLSKAFQVTKIKREMHDFISNPNNGTLEQKAEAVSEQIGKLLELHYQKEAFWLSSLK